MQKNLLCLANYKKPIKKARRNYSSFLIIGSHKKIWSHAKTIFGTPSLPHPSPPFPPQSSVFQDYSIIVFYYGTYNTLSNINTERIIRDPCCPRAKSVQKILFLFYYFRQERFSRHFQLFQREKQYVETKKYLL